MVIHTHKLMEIKLNQNIDQIKEYRRCGSSMNGVDLIIEYKNGETESFHSTNHTFQKTVNEIQKYWKTRHDNIVLGSNLCGDSRGK